MLSIMHQDKKLPHAVHLTHNQEWILITRFLCSVQRRPSSGYLEETEDDEGLCAQTLEQEFLSATGLLHICRSTVVQMFYSPSCIRFIAPLHLKPKPPGFSKANQLQSTTKFWYVFYWYAASVTDSQHIQTTSFNLCHFKYLQLGYFPMNLLAGLICMRVCVVGCYSDCLSCLLTLNKCDSSDRWEAFHALKCLVSTTSSFQQDRLS